MKGLSLRWKIFSYSSGLLVVLVVATLFYVRTRAGVYVNDRITDELVEARDRITRVERDRMIGLRETAALVASFPELKALLETDEATVRDFLLNYLQQSQRSELLVALDPSGQVIARTDSASTTPLPDARTRWIDPVFESGHAEGLLLAGDAVYHAAAVASDAGGIVFGFILAGAPVDDEFAATLGGGGNEIALLVGDRVVGTTLPRETLPSGAVGVWQSPAAPGSQTRELLVASERFVATETMIGGNPLGVLAIVLQSRDRAMEPYRSIELGLLALGLLVTGIGVAGSVLLSKTMTAPVAKLVEGTKEVAAGNLEYRLNVTSRDEIGALAASFNTMVEERRRLEHQVQHSQKLEAVGRLAGGVAHDFNNLLMVITGRAEKLLSTLGANHPMRRDLQLIYDASKRGAGLTGQLLAFSRRQILRPRLVNLDELLSGMEDMLRRLIGEDIDLRLALSGRVPRVKADPGQIEQVIMNLVVNARDAMPEGGTLTITTENGTFDEARLMHVMEVPAGRYAVVAVSDTGLGIDDSVRAHLFEPFFTTKDATKGTGLGLSTVYGIVQQSGGYIDVSSEPNRGATFTILLPSADVGVESLEHTTGREATLDGSETILIVEDEKEVRDLLEEVLRSCGYSVLTAGDGQEAIAVAAGYANRIHLMLTDVLMPHMRGPELARRLQATRPDMRVLFMSGYTDQTLDLSNRNVGILHKPFTSRQLSGKVREVLNSPQELAGAVS